MNGCVQDDIRIETEELVLADTQVGTAAIQLVARHGPDRIVVRCQVSGIPEDASRS